MKLVAVLVLASLSTLAVADHHNEMNFDKAKAMMLEGLDKRINTLQATKTCVTNSTTKEQLKECRKNMRSSMEAMKKDRKNWKEKKKDKKKK